MGYISGKGTTRKNMNYLDFSILILLHNLSIGHLEQKGEIGTQIVFPN